MDWVRNELSTSLRAFCWPRTPSASYRFPVAPSNSTCLADFSRALAVHCPLDFKRFILPKFRLSKSEVNSWELIAWEHQTYRILLVTISSLYVFPFPTHEVLFYFGISSFAHDFRHFELDNWSRCLFRSSGCIGRRLAFRRRSTAFLAILTFDRLNSYNSLAHYTPISAWKPEMVQDILFSYCFNFC